MLVIEQKKQDEIDVFQFIGEFDLDGLEAYQDFLAILTPSARIRIILDFSDLNFISSYGIRCIGEILRLCKTKNGQVLFAHMNEKIQKTLQVCNLLRLLKVYDSVDRALSELG